MSHDRTDGDVERDGVEFRYWGDELDEVVARNVNVHFECMGPGSWWMIIQTPDGRDFHVNLGVKKSNSRSESAELKWREKNLANWAFHEEDV